MYRKSFVKKSISSLTASRFERLKNVLNDEKYIPFDFIEADKIDRIIFEEKVSDYFEKVELLAGGKKFSFVIENYADVMNSVVREHVEQSSLPLRGGSQPDTRAKKYYDKACTLKRNGLKTFEELLDYSRIMLCLYMAIINKKHGHISDFDYSSECLDGSKIMASLREEKTNNIVGTPRKRFDTKGPYSTDRCAFIMIIIMYQYIKSKEVGDEN